MATNGVFIDDQHHWLERLPPRLARHGVIVTAFSDPAAAISHIRDHGEVEFVISDYRFKDRGYDGLWVLEQIARDLPARALKRVLMSVLQADQLSGPLPAGLTFISKEETSDEIASRLRAL